MKYSTLMFRRPCGRRNNSTLRSPLAPDLRAIPRTRVPKYASPPRSRESRARGGFSLTYCANLGRTHRLPPRLLPRPIALCAFAGERIGNAMIRSTRLFLEIGGPSCCCAHNIFSPSLQNRSRTAPCSCATARIRDIGTADMLKLRYPDEEVVDFGLAAAHAGPGRPAHPPGELRSCAASCTTCPTPPGSRPCWRRARRWTWATGTTRPSWAVSRRCLQRHHLRCRHHARRARPARPRRSSACARVIYREVGAMDKRRVDYAMRVAENDIMHWREEVDSSRITIGIAPGGHLRVPSLDVRPASSELRATATNMPVAMHLAGSREEYNFIKYGSSPFSVHDHGPEARLRGDPAMACPRARRPMRYALNWGAFESAQRAGHPLRARGRRRTSKKLKEYDVAVGRVPALQRAAGHGRGPDQRVLALRACASVIGTDSPAATDSTDMLTEMRIGMLVQRAVNVGKFLDSARPCWRWPPSAARARSSWTTRSARWTWAKRADVIAVDLSGSHQTPIHRPGFGRGEHLQRRRRAHDHGGRHACCTRRIKWHVDVEVAKNIARVIEIRGKLRM